MKEKNLLDDIESKSLEELNNLVNKIINNLEKKSLEDFVQEYQELIKLNNYIERKFHQEAKSISILLYNYDFILVDKFYCILFFYSNHKIEHWEKNYNIYYYIYKFFLLFCLTMELYILNNYVLYKHAETYMINQPLKLLKLYMENICRKLAS